MAITKGQIVSLAQREITKIDGEIFNTNAFDKNQALVTLEMTIGSLESDGIQLGYVYSVDNDPYWDDPSGISNADVWNLAKYLAKFIYPANSVNPLVLSWAKEGYDKMLPILNTPTMGNPLIPAGTGNFGWNYGPTYLSVDQPIDIESDSVITT